MLSLSHGDDGMSGNLKRCIGVVTCQENNPERAALGSGGVLGHKARNNTLGCRRVVVMVIVMVMFGRELACWNGSGAIS